MADNRCRTWTQLSLRTILWIMLCVGLGFGMYRQGFQAGRNYKEPPPAPAIGYAQVYYIEDLLDSGLYESSRQGFDDIRQQVTTNVLPASWTENGGKASVRMFESNRTLVVRHDKSGHERVASYLKFLRQSASRSEVNSQ